MTRLEKIQKAIELGYTYEPLTGNIIKPNGTILNSKIDGYIRLNLYINKKSYYLFGHQFAWYIVYGEIVGCIDHIDRDKSNNKIDNLRSITQKQNTHNSNSNGFYYDKINKKYKACIQSNGKRHHLGCFDTPEEAHLAYLDAKKIYHNFQ